MWICEHCGADVEEGWEVCWSCTRPRTPAGGAAGDEGREADQAGGAAPPCPRCGSTTMIPGVQIATPQGLAVAHLPEAPEALIFKGGGSSPIVAEVCASCGHIALRASDPAFLWHLYRQLQAEREP